MEERDELIRKYFRLGLKQTEILAMLAIKHNYLISDRQLKRLLQRLGLRRRVNFSNLDEVRSFIENELVSSGQLPGYRWMHLRCLQQGLVVKQKTVRLLLKELDPVGVDIRTRRRLRRRTYKNKGPNYLWHLDGYDKLKPYGICIHGCIDGFSRHLMWLKASSNTSDPKIIAGYFCETVEAIGGCPVRVRADCGTENRFVEQMQIFLREKEDSAPETAWLYGTSQSNQRIEAWWAILRSHDSQYWMNFFQQLKDDGLFSGSFIDKSLIQFCFMRIIQEELNTIVVEWNSHSITTSRNSVAPAGRPLLMYNVPQIYSTKDFLRDIDRERLEKCKDECLHNPICDQDVFDLCIILMEEQGLEPPIDHFNAVTLYSKLREEMQQLGLF